MTRYAVILVGSHQYQVEENRIFEVEKMTSLPKADAEAKEVKLDQVLLVQDNGKAKVGQPFIPKASVTCEILETVRLPKVISFKFKRRKGYKRKKGHRQTVVRLKVKSIQTG
ncbi:MAG: 50S ribosomal protein L21 [Candidatus Omnitrophica bacterium]|nr:50S ribosomal protein L21 [Candidatus Omnitrophota bacterium]